MFYLRTNLDSKDAFVLAVRNAFQHAGVALLAITPGQSPPDSQVVRLELQPDRTTVMVSLPLGDPPRRQEFLEESPDILEIAVRDSLVRALKKKS